MPSRPATPVNRARDMLAQIWQAIGGAPQLVSNVDELRVGALPSAFAVSDLASAVVASAALAAAEFIGASHGRIPRVSVDRRLASLWFASSLRPVGWKVPPVWDAIAGDYPTADGWIRLHTNAPAHRAAALRVIGTPQQRTAVEAAVLRWNSDELEAAVYAAGGCAAAMRSLDRWAAHAQGQAVAAEPLVHVDNSEPGETVAWRVDPERPLRDIRVLDLTRVLAGPVATRFLAALGAQVLRIDPPDWDEPGLVPEVTLGKRCARLDLRAADDRSAFEVLVRTADMLVHGYRPGALAGLGYGPQRLQTLRPGLVDVRLDAYGWTGPWKGRRGFDSLVQMSSGIAAEGMRHNGADRPVPLPVQALDHATGYLLAATALRALTRRVLLGTGTQARASLARTAAFLVSFGGPASEPPLAPETLDDRASAVEQSGWGPAHRLHPPVTIDGCPLRWSRPASRLGSADARW